MMQKYELFRECSFGLYGLGLFGLHWYNFGDTWEILSHYLGLDMVATWGRPTRYSAYGQSLDRFSDKVRQQTQVQ